MATHTIRNVVFEDCYFQNTQMTGTKLTTCTFTRCEFEGLTLTADMSMHDVVFHDCECRSVTAPNSDTAVFSPRMVSIILEQSHVNVTYTEARPLEQAHPVDEKVVVVERLLRAFMRSSGVNENTLQKRLGTQAAFFSKEVLPVLLECRIVEEELYRGGGTQSRYRLGMPLAAISRAIEGCNGSFERFVEILSSGDEQHRR